MKKKIFLKVWGKLLWNVFLTTCFLQLVPWILILSLLHDCRNRQSRSAFEELKRISFHNVLFLACHQLSTAIFSSEQLSFFNIYEGLWTFTSTTTVKAVLQCYPLPSFQFHQASLYPSQYPCIISSKNFDWFALKPRRFFHRYSTDHCSSSSFHNSTIRNANAGLTYATDNLGVKVRNLKKEKLIKKTKKKLFIEWKMK